MSHEARIHALEQQLLVAESHVAAAQQERDALRSAMITALSATRAVVGPACSSAFLCSGAEEIRLYIAKLQQRADEAERLAAQRASEMRSMVERVQAAMGNGVDDARWKPGEDALTALIRERDAFQHDVLVAAGEMMVPIPEPGTVVAQLLAANAIMRRQHTEALQLAQAAQKTADQWIVDSWDTVEAVGVALGLPKPDRSAPKLPPEWTGKLSEKAAAVKARMDHLQKIVDATLAELPVGYAPSHTAENIPAMVADWLREAAQAETSTRDQALESAVGGPHQDPHDCSTWRDGCHCTVETLRDLQERHRTCVDLLTAYLRLGSCDGRVERRDLRRRLADMIGCVYQVSTHAVSH